MNRGLTARDFSCKVCGPPSCECETQPRRWLSRRKVVVTPESPSLVMAKRVCPTSPYLDAPRVYIRRRGSQPFTLAYEQFDFDSNGDARFMFDSKIFALAPGRYEAQVRQGTQCCGSFEIVIPSNCVLGETNIKTVRGHSTVIHNQPLQGVSTMFDQLLNLNLTLCRVMEPGSDELPVSAADAAILCGLVACRPVELIIHDGVKQEIVSFASCMGTTPLVARGAAGTTPARWAIGSQVSFSWTSGNVAVAAGGCV